MPKIVFLDRATIAPQIRLRAPAFPHEPVVHEHTQPEQVVERLAGASIAMRGSSRGSDGTTMMSHRTPDGRSFSRFSNARRNSGETSDDAGLAKVCRERPLPHFDRPPGLPEKIQRAAEDVVARRHAR